MFQFDFNLNLGGIVSEYSLAAYNKTTNEEIIVGHFDTEEDAYEHLMYNLNWDKDAIKEDWFFQVLPVELECS